MRTLPPEFATEIDKRAGLRVRTFIRFTARDRADGSAVILGLWNGIDHVQMPVDGQIDTFYGAGAILGLADIDNSVGTPVRSYTLKVAPLAIEVATLLRVYEPKGARATIYSALYSTETGLLLTPNMVRRFHGWVDKCKIITPASGGNGEASITLVSSARNLTRTVPARRSHANQTRRVAGDNFLEYTGITGQVETPWGTKRVGDKESHKVLGMRVDARSSGR